nr:hypothetical protein [uncultured Pseudomonas sp.]
MPVAPMMLHQRREHPGQQLADDRIDQKHFQRQRQHGDHRITGEHRDYGREMTDGFLRPAGQ